MKKYFQLLQYETKTIIRDPFQMFLLVLPVLILLMAVFLFPTIFSSMNPADEAARRITTLVMIMVILAVSNLMIGAMASFMLLEHKDEHTIATIAVTPMGTSGYLTFKMAYVYFLSFISMIIVLLGIKLFAANEYIIGGVSVFENLSYLKLIVYALVSALFAPSLALLLGALAKNKVEGFAFVKSTGIIAMLPALMLLDAFSGWMQYVLGIFPNFWSMKAILLEILPSAHEANLSFTLYMVIGAAYNLFIFSAAYKTFMKKVQY